MSDDAADLIATARAVALAVNDDEITSEQQAKLAQVDLLHAAALDRIVARLADVEARLAQVERPAPLAAVPDYVAPPDITLATVLRTPEDIQRWRDENGGR